MTDTNLTREISDRFVRFEKHFHRSRATPIVVVGISEEPGPRVVISADGADDDQVRDLLVSALRLMGLPPHRNLEDRRPLGPAAVYQLRACEPALELQGALAALGFPLTLEVIEDWPPDQFFEALHWARTLQSPERPKFTPDKPSFIR